VACGIDQFARLGKMVTILVYMVHMKKTIQAKWVDIVLYTKNESDYISLTDIARYKNAEHPADVVKNRLRTRNTIEFLGIWEQINNVDFKLVEFDQFKDEAWSNAFVMTPQKRIRETNAIWFISKSWRWWGTYAHKDIAFKFASWISPEFELYIIKDYQRLKQVEEYKQAVWRDAKRMIASMNYKIQTDAIETFLIPSLTDFQQKYAYANEADMLNLIVRWQTAKERREKEPELAKKSNMRDHAHVVDLVILANLESFNAKYIEEGLAKDERYEILAQIAITQKKSLLEQYAHLEDIKKLEE